MIDLDYRAFPSWSQFLAALREALLHPGAARLRPLEADDSNVLLIRLSQGLGLPIPDRADGSQNSLVENTFITRVENRPTPIRDGLGYTILSSTAAEFPSHTDQYLNPHPADVVLFQCVKHDPQGGDTLLIYLADILPQLSMINLAILSSPTFPTHYGRVAILSQTPAGQWRIRYNRVEIERAGDSQGAPLNVDQKVALNALDRAIQTAQRQFPLLENECLVVNNQTALHGRTAFMGDSGRLLKRVRLHFQP